MATKVIKYGIEFETNQTSLNELRKELQSIQTTIDGIAKNNSISDELKKSATDAKKLEQILSSSWNNKLNNFDLSKLNKQIKESYGGLENMKKTLESTSTGARVYNQLANNILGVNLQLKESNKLLDKMAITMGNTIRFGISSSVFNRLTGSLEQAWGFSKNLDTSLNDIRIVTGKSADEMERFAQTANKAAKNLGSSTLDYTKAALIYAQQGLGDTDIAARTETTLKAANVTGQSGEAVSEQLTAVWNGYKASAQETELYVDKLAAVAATTASDLEELSVGMSKVASAANLMGVDIDQLNAQIATIISVTRQAPESVGTALKTIYARMGDIESGIDTETTLGEYTSKMAEMGVNVLDTNGELRDMGLVIEEIGGKWKSMSREQQIALSQTMAGTRQYNNLLSLFDSWDMYTKALDTSRNSAGELQKQQDIFMESTEAHLQRLATEAENTYSILFDKEAVNGFADSLTGLLGIFNTFLSGLDGGVNALTFLGATLSNVFNKQIARGLNIGLTNLNANKANKDALELQRDVVEQGLSTEVGSSPAALLASQEDLERMEQLLNIQKDISVEDFNRLNQIRTEIAYNDVILEQYYKIQQGKADSLDEVEDNLNNINKELFEQSKVLEKIKKLRNSIENGNDKEKLKAKEDLKAIFSSKGLQDEENKFNYKLKKKDFNLVKEDDVIALENIDKILKQQNKTIIEKQVIQKQLSAEIEAYKKGEKEIAEIERTQLRLKSQFNIEDENRVKYISNVIQGVSSLVQVSTALVGIVRTLNDTDLSTGEKAEQIISVLVATTPAIILNFSQIMTILPNMAKALGATAAQAKTAGSSFMWMWAKFLAPIAPIVAGIAAIVAGLVILERAITAEERAAEKAKKKVEELNANVAKTRQNYEELTNTISNYNSALDGIKNLEEGTLEFYDAILKANSSAQELIDKFELIAGKDYTIGQGGLIQINENSLEQAQFEEQQEIYRKQLQVIQTKYELLEQSQRKLVQDFKNSINTKGSIIQGTTTESAEKILTNTLDKKLATDLKDSNITISYEQTDNSFLDEIVAAWNKSTDTLPEKIASFTSSGVAPLWKTAWELIKSNSGKEELDNIQDEVDSFRASYEQQSAQLIAYQRQMADNIIRGYGSKSQVELYNEMLSPQQEIIQDFVAKSQLQEFNKKSFEQRQIEKFWDTSESSDKNFWEKFFGNIGKLGLFGGANVLGFSGMMIDQINQNQKNWDYREQYAKDVLEYQKIDNQWYDKEGQRISDKDLKKNIDIKQAKNYVESGAAKATEEFTSIIESYSESLKKSFESGIKDSESQEFIAEAITAVKTNKTDYDFSALTKDQLDEAKKQAENLPSLDIQDKTGNYTEAYNKLMQATSDITAVAARRLKDYNEAMDRFAGSLKTTSSGLKIYDAALQNSQKRTVNYSRTTADAAAASYKFNKAYNEGRKTFEDNKDAWNDYTKALKNNKPISYDVADGAGEIVEKLKEMGIVLSTEQLKDPKTLKQIKTLLTGTATEAEKAYNKLQETSWLDNLTSKFGLAKNEANSFIEALNKIKDGEEFNIPEDLLNKMNNVKMSLEDWRAWAEQFGINVDVKIPSTEVDSITPPEEETVTTHTITGMKRFIDNGTSTSWEELPGYTYTETVSSPKPTIYGIGNLKFTKSGNSKKNFSPSKGKKSGSKSEPKKEDRIKDEKDRYHDVNVQLNLIGDSLDRLDKQSDKLFGAKKIDNLNKQLRLLNKEIEVTNQKIAIAKDESKELQGILGKQGVLFNADGTIANYAQAYDNQLAYVNSIIDKYNSMDAKSQEKYQDTLDQAKENWSQFLEDMERYDELITDFIPDLQDKITEDMNKQIELNVEKFDMEIEIRLDMKEATKNWNDWKKKIIDGIEEDDILGNAQARVIDYDIYYNQKGTGSVQALTKQVNDTLNELYKMDRGEANIYGSNSLEHRNKALEDLNKYYTELMGHLSEVAEIEEDIHQAYLDMMDEAQDKFDEQIEAYETVSGIIEHDMELIKLIKGEEAYGEMITYYDKQHEINLEQLDFLKQQEKFWENAMNNAEAGSDEWVKAKESWVAAVEETNNKITDSIQNIQDRYLAMIEKTFQDLNKKVTGGVGLNYVETQWDLMKKQSEQYLDTVNAIYGVQQLASKYQDSIDNTDSISAQRKLNALMNEEIAALQEKDKLSKYDLDRAELRYQIALKQIALEEAQQNKSSMRLKRDSQGNYSYQFVADDNAINSIQDEISNLYNQLYNLDLTAYNNNLDQIYSLWVEMQEKMKEAAQINDPEERSRMELLIKQQYGELINNLVGQNEEIRTNLQESTFMELEDFYTHDTEVFKTNLGEKFQGLEQALEDSKLKSGELAEGVTTAFGDIIGLSKELFEDLATNLTGEDGIMASLVNGWTSGIQTMANVISQEGGFEETCKDAWEAIDKASSDYEITLGKIETTSDRVFDDIINGQDELITKTEDLVGDNKNLIETYESMFNSIDKVVDKVKELIEEYKKASEAAKQAATDAYNYEHKTKDEAANAAAADKGEATGGPVDTMTPPATTTPTPVSAPDSSNGGTLAPGTTVKLKSGHKYHNDSYGNGPHGAWKDATKVGTQKAKSGAPYPIHLVTQKGAWRGWVKKSDLVGYDTGGYTGAWGKDGKLAMLHQKELVLNETDTKNMLNAVEVMRSITSSLGANLFDKLVNISANNNLAFAGTNGQLEQNVHIDAHFPNVKESHEIEDAINNLMNKAQQAINKKR